MRFCRGLETSGKFGATERAAKFRCYRGSMECFMAFPYVRKGMPPVKLGRQEFERRYKSRFVDPAFDSLDQELQKITDAAWDAYADSRKAPHTCKAGPGFADPDYDLSVDWLAACDAIALAQRAHD